VLDVRTSTRSASTPATRSSSRPVQTLTDAVHQRLRSAALAIIRALGVEGGCNVQFALSPDSTEYAVIEVNPRVSRSSALASKATGYPIARVAAQIAIGPAAGRDPERRDRHDRRGVRAGARLRRGQAAALPVRQVPGRDRTLGSQMKATGEVMAIDRTFGSALNKALRGLEQAGAQGPLDRGPELEPPAFDYLSAVYGGSGLAGRSGRDEPIRWSTRRARPCESTPLRPALGSAVRAAPVPRPV
jgi:carbamoylphosphate synthase large subunit